MRSEFALATTSPPIRLISVDSASSRSVSWPRRCPIPRRRDGVSARAATAATTGVSSPTSRRFRSTPRMTSGPVRVRPSAVRAVVAPISAKIARSWSPGCVVVVGHCGTVTCPPVTIAAARKGAALDRSGSIVRSTARIRPGATSHQASVGSSTWLSISTPDSRSIAADISMCGSEGSAAPRCRTRSPSSNRAPDSSNALTYWLESLASRVTDPPETWPSPSDRERQRVAAVVVDAHAQGLQGHQDRAHRAHACARVAVEPDIALRQPRDHRAGTASPCRPARSRRGRGRAASAGSTAQPSSVDLIETPSERSPAAMSLVSRAFNGREIVLGPSARAASTSARLVRDLLPGTSTRA